MSRYDTIFIQQRVVVRQKGTANMEKRYEKENRKVLRKGRGTMWMECGSCAFITPVDYALLEKYMNPNSRVARMQHASDSMTIAGASMSMSRKKRALAEQIKTNRLLEQQMLQQGINCGKCGYPLVEL